jgi:predicted DCC family thiol-disulfide oxidoreductase YuxK
VNQTPVHTDEPTASQLPTPGQRPTADLVIYDGQCQFCRRSVERLRRLDSQQRLAFISLHDPEVSRRFPDLTKDQLLAEIYVVDQQGRRYGGAAAIRYLSRRLPRLWPLAPLMHLPGSLPLWNYLYRWVARRRYLLGGATCEDDTCQLKP